MGAIARSAANNITTAGVFTPSALNSSSVTGITVLPNASDGITFISSQTASSSASLSFTTGIDSTYKAYKFVFVNCHPQTDAVSFDFNLSTDSGSNYNVTKTTTFVVAHQAEDGTDTFAGYEGSRDLAQSTSFQLLNYVIDNDNDSSLSGSLTLFNTASTTQVKHFYSNTNIVHHNPSKQYSINCYVSGYGNTLSAINAVRFQMSSGNIDAGTIYMYGIK